MKRYGFNMLGILWGLIYATQASPYGMGLNAPLLKSLEIGGQLRFRGETRNPLNYTSSTTTATDFVLQRTRIHLDGKVTDNLRAYVAFQDSRTWGEETSIVADMAGLDLYQGFLQVNGLMEYGSLRIGRMAPPALGDQRHFSPLPWHNVSRSWDGLYATFIPADWTLHAFHVNTREANIFASSGTSKWDDDYTLSALYATFRQISGHEVDLYAVLRDESDANFTNESGATGDHYDVTTGLRIAGKGANHFYTGEFSYQFGDNAGDSISAWAGAISGGYTFNDVAYTPRVTVEYAMASGDDSASDNEEKTFRPLLPFTHSFHGYMDLVAWQNMRAAKVGFQLVPCRSASIHLDNHTFWINEKNDAWYGVGFSNKASAGSYTSNYLGNETDFYVKWKAWDRVGFWTGISYFFAGDVITESGTNDDNMIWTFAQAIVNF